MRGERVRQPQRRRELCAVQARPQNPQRHFQARPRHGTHAPSRLVVGEVALQLHDVGRKRVDVSVQIAPQRAAGLLVGARGATDPQVDPSREQRRERPELLRDDQGRMVGQHDAARAHPDRRRSVGDVADHDRGRRAGDARHVVVLGDPVASIAPTLRMLGQIGAVA